MQLKHKMIITAVSLSVIPVLIASLAISGMAVNKSFHALEEVAKERLIALRDVKKDQVLDYIDSIKNQVQNLSRSNQVIEAMDHFNEAVASYNHSYSAQNIESWRTELGTYYSNEFGKEYSKRNSNEQVDAGKLLADLDANAVALQYKYIQKNSNPLGAKDKLVDARDGTLYSDWHDSAVS